MQTANTHLLAIKFCILIAQKMGDGCLQLSKNSSFFYPLKPMNNKVCMIEKFLSNKDYRQLSWQLRLIICNYVKSMGCILFLQSSMKTAGQEKNTLWVDSEIMLWFGIWVKLSKAMFWITNSAKLMENYSKLISGTMISES